nr:hypothetical protein [Escherichia coli]
MYGIHPSSSYPCALIIFIPGEGALIITYPIRKAGNQNVTRISKMQRFNISVFSVSPAAKSVGRNW